MSRSWLVTGASRGIGQALVNALAARGDFVYAAVRSPQSATGLSGKANIEVVQLDVSDQISVDSLASKLRETGKRLNGLINNAGVALEDRSGTVQTSPIEVYEKTLEINTLGPIRVTKAFLPLLDPEPFPIVVNVTSILGSISLAINGFGRSYPISKAALNMFTRLLSLDLKGGCAISLHPGWVKTEMGGEDAPLSLEESIEGIMKSERFVSVQAAAPSSVYCIVGGVAFIISFGLGATAAVLVRRP